MAYKNKGFAVDYVNVREHPERLDEMLAHSGGQRKVPVLLSAEGKVTIGFGGS